MSVNDPIADFLVVLKNASLVGKEEVVTPFSKFKLNILEVLKKEGFIENYTHDKNKKNNKDNNITVKLRYHEKQPIIKDAKRVSRVGRRVYMNKYSMPDRQGNRVWFVSTSKGIFTALECKEKGIGGEILCYFE